LAAAPLAGCRDTIQTAAAPAGPAKRELTDAEKQTIAHAVSMKMNVADGSTRFLWAQLIVKARDGAADYCGLVSGKYVQTSDDGYSKFYVQLTYGDGQTLSAVNVRAMGEDETSRDVADSLCQRYGYGDLSAR